MILSLGDTDRDECLCRILINPLTAHLIEKNIDILNSIDDNVWNYFYANSSNIQLIEKNLVENKINDENLEYLIVNEHAIDLIEKNLDKISVGIYENPNIFELDSKKYKNDMNIMINEIYNL